MKVQLAKNDLWKEFNLLENEMIITKNGRNLFPALEYEFQGLNPEDVYMMCVHIERYDKHRYKFQGGEWSQNGPGESYTTHGVWHEDGPRPGSEWMRRFACFSKLKVTNNLDDPDPNHVFVHSMHKYVPVLTIFRVLGNPYVSMFGTYREEVGQFRFDDASFIAVTAYQNNDIKNLKVEKNKYARGFRNERKRTSTSPDTQEPKRRALQEIQPPSWSANVQMPPHHHHQQQQQHHQQQQTSQAYYPPQFQVHPQMAYTNGHQAHQDWMYSQSQFHNQYYCQPYFGDFTY